MAYTDVVLSGISVAGLALVSFASRRIQGSWLAPGASYAGAWFAFGLLALVLVPDSDIWPLAVGWILLSAVAVMVASSLGIAAREMSWLEPTRFQGQAEFPGIRLLIVLTSIGGLGVAISLLRDKGIGISGLTSLPSLARTEHIFSVARYIQNYREPLVARLLVTSIYVGALLAGLFLATKRRETTHAWIAFLPLFPALAITAVATERASFAYPIVLTSASYIAARVQTDVSLSRLITRRRLLVGGGGLALLLVLSVMVLVGRYGYSNGSELLTILPTIRYDVFGYLVAFSRWFRHGASVTHNLTFGSFTFAGLFDVLHLRVRAAGIYTDPVQINGRATNVFTAFRGLIEDFGLIGALAILGLIGFVAGVAYREVRRGSGIAIAILAAFLASILWSPIVDLFAYNSIIAAWVIFGVYVVYAAHRSRLRRQQGQLNRSVGTLSTTKVL